MITAVVDTAAVDTAACYSVVQSRISYSEPP